MAYPWRTPTFFVHFLGKKSRGKPGVRQGYARGTPLPSAASQPGRTAHLLHRNSAIFVLSLVFSTHLFDQGGRWILGTGTKSFLVPTSKSNTWYISAQSSFQTIHSKMLFRFLRVSGETYLKLLPWFTWSIEELGNRRWHTPGGCHLHLYIRHSYTFHRWIEVDLKTFWVNFTHGS